MASSAYALGGPEAARSVFGEVLVLRATAPAGRPGTELALEHAEEVTRAVRGALLRHAEDPPPAALSGHRPDGGQLERPHVGFTALTDVGWPEARGARRRAGAAVDGVGIVLPREIDAADRVAVLAAAARWECAGLRAVLGTLGELQLARVDVPDPVDPLHPLRWVGPSRRWASVTPVALHRNPGRLFRRGPGLDERGARRAQESIARACEHVGLPAPARVRLMRESLFAGAPPAARFAPYPRCGQGFRRLCVHVELDFGNPVTGPVLLGAGRYFGVGLCAPWIG